MSITRGKSSNSTGFPRNCPVHPLFFAPHNRICQGQHWKPTRNWILHVLQNDRRLALYGVGGLFILTFSLQSNRSRWVVMKRKISALQSNVACCRYLHPAELFLPFVKMWQRLLFCAAQPRHPPHSGTNPSDGSTAAKIRAFIRFYINTQGEGAQLALINSREF